MDELTLVRDVGRDTPGPSPSETAAARARLLDVMASHRSAADRAAPRRPLRRTRLGRLAGTRFWAPAAAAAAVTALAVAAALVAVPRPSGAPGAGSAAKVPGAPQQSPSASAVLGQAAAAAARQAPGTGQYFVREAEILTASKPRDPYLQTEWIGNGVPGWEVTGSPRGQGFYPLGDPHDVPASSPVALTWAQLQTMPTQPRALLAEISQWTVPPVGLTTTPASQKVAEELLYISQLLMAPTPAAVRSALYRAAAMLPGLTAVLHGRDLVGRSATEVFSPVTPARTRGVLFLDPGTGAVLGWAGVASKARCPSLDTELAFLSSGYVSSTAQLPPGAPRAPLPVARPTMIPSC